MPQLDSYSNVTPEVGDKFPISDASNSDATQNVLISALATLLNAAPVMTGITDLSAGGAYFGTAAAANLLDDYEKGTWTPAISGLTLSVSYATYTKIGRKVFIECACSYSSGTGSGKEMTGLPFTASGSNRSAVSIALAVGIDFNGTAPIGAISGTSINFRGFNDNAATGDADFSTFGSGDSLQFSGTFDV